MKDWRHWAIGILASALIAGGGIGFTSWLSQHDDRLMLKAKLDAEDQIISTKDKQISDRDAALSKQLSDFESLKRQQLTPQQIVREIPQLVPGLPKIVEEPLPNSPTVQVPTEDLKTFRDFALSCKECDAKLSTAQANAVDVQSKLDAVTKERDLALAVVHGGTKWQRFTRSLKAIGIGVLVGLAADEAVRHR